MDNALMKSLELLTKLPRYARYHSEQNNRIEVCISTKLIVLIYTNSVSKLAHSCSHSRGFAEYNVFPLPV